MFWLEHLRNKQILGWKVKWKENETLILVLNIEALANHNTLETHKGQQNRKSRTAKLIESELHFKREPCFDTMVVPTQGTLKKKNKVFWQNDCTWIYFCCDAMQHHPAKHQHLHVCCCLSSSFPFSLKTSLDSVRKGRWWGILALSHCHFNTPCSVVGVKTLFLIESVGAYFPCLNNH